MHGVCGRVGDRAIHLVDALGHEADGFAHQRQVHVDHVRDRLAHVERIQHSKFFAVPVDQVREPVQDAHAIARVHPRPDPGPEGRPGRRHGPIDVLFRTRRHAGDDLGGGWVYGFETTAVDGVGVVAVDEVAGFHGARGTAGERVPLALVMVPDICKAHAVFLVEVIFTGWYRV